MDDKMLFADFWLNESKTTRNVLARIPEGSDEFWSSDARSQSQQSRSSPGDDVLIVRQFEPVAKLA